MNSTVLKIASAGILFLFIFLTGFWLRRSGKPYNAISFNFHKLIGLAALIYLVTTVYRTHQATPLGPLEITAVAITVLFFCRYDYCRRSGERPQAHARSDFKDT